MPRTNFIGILRQRAEIQPRQIAYRYLDTKEGESSVSYGNLWTRVKTLATLFQENGAIGKRVLLLYPPGLEFISAFFATLAAGAIAVPINIPRRNQKRTHTLSILHNADASFALKR